MRMMREVKVVARKEVTRARFTGKNPLAVMAEPEANLLMHSLQAWGTALIFHNHHLPILAVL